MDHERLLMRRGVSDAASSPPATHATTPGTTGTAALTRKATGPNRASSTLDAAHCPTPECRASARRDPQRWRTYKPES